MIKDYIKENMEQAEVAKERAVRRRNDKEWVVVEGVAEGCGEDMVGVEGEVSQHSSNLPEGKVIKGELRKVVSASHGVTPAPG